MGIGGEDVMVIDVIRVYCYECLNFSLLAAHNGEMVTECPRCGSDDLRVIKNGKELVNVKSRFGYEPHDD